MTAPREARTLVCWVTCRRDGLDHTVELAELTTGAAGGRGYVAVCGHVVVPPTSVTSRRTERCSGCVTQRAALRQARGARSGIGAQLVELVGRAARMAAASG